MRTNSLNNAQLILLETFAGAQSQEEVNELSRVIRDHYARKLEDELEQLWDNETLDQAALDRLEGEHLRTPYRLTKDE